MLDDVDELDLGDIEAHLYSQVFHSNNQETPIETDNQESVENMRPPNRFFQPARTSKFINNVSNSNKKQKTRTKNKTTNFMKPTTQRQQRDLTTTLNQVVVVNPFNNIVCLQEVKQQSRKEIKRARWREKKRSARLQLQLQKVLEANTVKPINKPSPIISSAEIITLSDSENEDKADLLRKVREQQKTTSQIIETTTNTNNDDNTANDDVIFVEPPPIEVINLIEESPQKKTSDIETASTTSSSNKSTENDQKYLPHERKELLCTPESTSNDFMENTNIGLQQHKFNFSLHGADFINNNESNKPTTSSNNNNDDDDGNNMNTNKNIEICETESTCSTIDVNLLKATVFKEIEFPRDDLFTEANLQNFGDLIIPTRTNLNKTRVETSTPIQKINNNKSIYDRSDSSSSESDFDDTNINNLQMDQIKKQMNLPNLSPILAINNNNNDDNTKTSKRKPPKIGSKFDLIGNERKNKKRKSSESNNIDKKKLNKNKKRKSDISINKEDNSCNKDNPIIDDIQESDTLILEATLNESIENYSENTIKPNIDNDNNHTDDNNENIEEVLRDFQIVDEVNNVDNEPIIIVTESESELSEINEHECKDIKLINCSNLDDQPTIENVENKNDINLQNSSVREVQQTMSDDPKLWEVSERDRNYIRKSATGRRCANCREIGHISIRCPSRKAPLRCRLCGGAGHLVYRCPNTMCVQCGTPGYSSTYCTYCYKSRELYCHICGMVGHVKNRCPDLWRRYHLTTEIGPLITHQGPILKPREQLWCSSCAQSGHLEHVCHFSYTPYAKYDPRICYYHDIYENFDKIEQLYPSSNNYQYTHTSSTQYPRERYFDNHHGNGERNNELIGRNANIDTNFYDNTNQRGIFESQSNDINNQEYENTIRRVNHYYMFHQKSFSSISYFLRTELRNLDSLYRDLENNVRNLKNSFNEQSHMRVSSFYKLLNMTLFGIYYFNNSKIHLQRLENSHLLSKKNKLMTRRNLYKSYCFIFGSDQHDNVDYRGLLSRI